MLYKYITFLSLILAGLSSASHLLYQQVHVQLFKEEQGHSPYMQFNRCELQ